jgi:hypothetical protein
MNNSELLEHVSEALRKAIGYLPSQGPLTLFQFENPMMALEKIPFQEALTKFSENTGKKTFLKEEEFVSLLGKGRILSSDLEFYLALDLGKRASEEIVPGLTRFQLRLEILKEKTFPNNKQEIHWLLSNIENVAELAGQLDKISCSEFLDFYENCLKFTIKQNPPIKNQVSRHRELLLCETSSDPELLVSELLIRFCSIYLDQGFGIWDLPQKEKGFYQSFSNLFEDSELGAGNWILGIKERLQFFRDQNCSSLEIALISLQELGINAEEFDDFIRTRLQSLRGWAGMINQLESRPDLAPQQTPKGSLVDFLAILLLLDCLAIKYVARKSFKFKNDSLAEIGEKSKQNISINLRSDLNLFAWKFFLIVAPRYEILSKSENYELWKIFYNELNDFKLSDRLFTYQRAYEKKIHDLFLRSFILRPVSKPKGEIELQVITCIDAREESFRRHLEETNPRIETFGAAGFFNMPMYYKGENQSFFSRNCPPVLTPSNWVKEVPYGSISQAHRNRTRTMQTLQIARHEVLLGSRKFSMGTILSYTIGYLASILLIVNVLFPRISARIKNWLIGLNRDNSKTRLTLERTENPPSPEKDHLGFTTDELGAMAYRLLSDIGLTNNFADLVIILGHGTTAVNNPHLSAYHCGACSGSPGSPNARGVAQNLNDRRTRNFLATKNIIIPDTTFFLGGKHDTSTEDVTFFDLDLLPETHKTIFQKTKDSLKTACEKNAHERCRKFFSAPLKISLKDAKRHVESRANDLAQPRVEYGNASNAACFVGRRSQIKNTFLDRRCFLVSYDPEQDTPSKDILARILGAVIVVCSGINLTYYFSKVDPTGWGCGTKLPHNPTSMIGVMDGSLSDLRSGLPIQGTEIHEPVRILFVIECDPEGIKDILSKLNNLAYICYNGWIRLVVIDPKSSIAWELFGTEFKKYEGLTSETPKAQDSLSWYQGKREFLDYAILTNEI